MESFLRLSWPWWTSGTDDFLRLASERLRSDWTSQPPPDHQEQGGVLFKGSEIMNQKLSKWLDNISIRWHSTIASIYVTFLLFAHNLRQDQIWNVMYVFPSGVWSASQHRLSRGKLSRDWLHCAAHITWTLDGIRGKLTPYVCLLQWVSLQLTFN